jgi:hypothetical protein
MVRSSRMSLYTEKIVPFFDELGYKDGSSIGNDVSGKTESLEDVIKKDSCLSFG